MKNAIYAWEGGYNFAGEKDNPYVALFFKDNDPFESAQSLLESGFAVNAVKIYFPLLQNMEILS
jgi:hypothetical protein